jgi:anthranilate synthase/aminodeoxychorismate synthase-like glutamine amidotransferase
LPLAERPRVLLIDNYDSFTYNLAQLLAMRGSEPIVRRNDAIGLDSIRALSPSAVVISPGPGHPAVEADFGISLAAIREFSGKVPILGICLGHQGIIHAFGGNVIRAKNQMHGKTSELGFRREGLFHNIEGPLEVMRYHSLVGEKSSLPECLRITAISKDDGQIMAVQHVEYDIFGLQFHPESIFTEKGPQMIDNFIQLVVRRLR